MRKPPKPSPTESPLLFDIDPQPIEETLTALGGIPLVVQAFRSLGLPQRVQEHVGVKERERGYDEATLVDRDNCGWTGFDQDAQSLLGCQSQATVAQDFRDKQSGTGQRQRFKTGAEGSVGWVEVAETLAQQRACDTHENERPTRQKPGREHDGK